MTCEECQPLAIDLARGLPPFDVGGAVERADVLSHIATCKRCAQWLREQEVLGDALRAAAAADASLSAPPGIEANVMAAFRARQAQRLPETQSPQTQSPQTHWPQTQRLVAFARPEPVADTVRPTQLVRARRPSWSAGRAVGFAAAATIVIAAVTLASVRWLSPSRTANPSPTGNVGMTSATRASTPVAPAAGSSGGRVGESTGTPVTGTNAAVIEVLPDKGGKTTKGRPAPPRVTPPRGATAGSATARVAAARVAAARDATARGATTRAATTRAAAARGFAADSTRPVNLARASEFSGPAFVLLPYAEPLRPTEMRHIMRVRVTKAQFAAAELRADGADDATVLADVLVGEDGTARAVRIVQ
jgi:hypothetical protein